jgi:hypothetical protein
VPRFCSWVYKGLSVTEKAQCTPRAHFPSGESTVERPRRTAHPLSYRSLKSIVPHHEDHLCHHPRRSFRLHGRERCLQLWRQWFDMELPRLHLNGMRWPAPLRVLRLSLRHLPMLQHQLAVERRGQVFRLHIWKEDALHLQGRRMRRHAAR